jgi:hypothetical protein
MWTTLSDEQDAAADGRSPADGSVTKPDYRFEGFKVELSEKVMLTPAAGAAPRAEGQ